MPNPPVTVPPAVFFSEGVPVGVGEGPGVLVTTVGVIPGVFVPVGTTVFVIVGLGPGVFVSVGIDVLVAVGLGPGVLVFVGVGTDVLVLVGVGLGGVVGVSVGTGTVGVGVGKSTQWLSSIPVLPVTSPVYVAYAVVPIGRGSSLATCQALLPPPGCDIGYEMPFTQAVTVIAPGA